MEGRERLRILSAVMGPATRALLAEVGIPPGSSCLDVGCGGGDVTVELARAAGSSGRAVGVDLDQTILELARRDAERQGIANVAFETRDVTEWKPDEPFDVVYVRFLLSHLADPRSVVEAMRACLRPGGAVVVEDVDFRGHFSEPDCPALRRYVELYTKSVQSRGADPNIGPRLPVILRDAGLLDVRVKVSQPVALEGGIKLLTCATLESIAETIVNDGLSARDGLRKTIEALRSFAHDPHTVLGGPRVFQAWGRSAV